jgi:hypothetical protein
LGFKVKDWGLGFRVQVEGLGFGILHFWFSHGEWSRVKCLIPSVGSNLRVQYLLVGFRVYIRDLGFRVLG